MAEFKTEFSDSFALPAGKIAFANIFAPDTKGKFPTNKFKITIMWPEENIPERVKEAKRVCLELAKRAWPDVPTKGIQLPFQRGDAKADRYPFMKGMICFNAKKKPKEEAPDMGRPLIVGGPDKLPLQPGQLKNGDFAVIVVSFFTYENTRIVEREDGTEYTKKVCGVSATLEIVHKRADGKPLPGSGGPNLRVLDQVDGGWEGDLDDETPSGDVADPSEAADDTDDPPW